MSRDFVGALLQLNAEKGVPREQLILTIADAIESAYRRIPGNEDVRVRIDPERGEMLVTRERRVVDVVEDPLTELTVEDARAIKPDAEVGEEIVTEQLGQDAFGRIGAQTAKQVVLQRLREAERDVVYDQFASREGDLITGTVNRVEPRAIILDLGKAEAILATTEQSPVEHYRIGQNVKAFVLEVRRAPRGPQVLVSRTHKGFLRRLFELEVPEIHAGTVEIKAIAREPGSRSKVAVASRQEGLDPVGATVGQRGARVQAVVAELAGEKIDVIEWSEDPAVFVAKALSPAQVVAVHIDEEHRIANVVVPEKMLSLAIGREGQNARLAAKMTGWRIDIRSDVQAHEPVSVPRVGPVEAEVPAGGGRGPGAGSRGRPCGGGGTVARRAVGGLPARQHPTRTCVACRTPRQKRELLRVVRTPGGAVVVDPTGRAPGRGAYVCADAACQAAALEKGALRRALAVAIPAGLFDVPPFLGAAASQPRTHDDQEGGA